jgi:hypothetical protein
MIDALGVTLTLDDNQQLTDVLVIGRIADFTDGQTGLVIGSSNGMDWITQLGLIAAARGVLEAEPARPHYDEDDD